MVRIEGPAGFAEYVSPAMPLADESWYRFVVPLDETVWVLGGGATAIQELAGHSDLVTTQRYMHLSPAAKDSAIRLLEQPPPVGDILETGVFPAKSGGS